MAIYTVYAPPDADVSPETADDLRFIKDGFSFAALVIPLFWLLWNRMWLVLLGWLAAALAIEAIARFAGEGAAAAVAIALGLWFATEARDLQRWTLTRRGWTLVGVVEGGALDTAERRFFEAWLADDKAAADPDGTPKSQAVAPPVTGPRPPPLPPMAATPPPAVPRPARSGVIGLFPETGGGRT